MSSSSTTTEIASSSSSTGDRSLLRGVVFDMDGTLTVPNLDFGAMYDRCGVDRNADILAEIAGMTDPIQRQRANDVIEEMEEEGRRTLELAPGAAELGAWLVYHGVPTALVTRNVHRTVDRLVDGLWKPALNRMGIVYGEKSPFIPAMSRDDDYNLPPKPDPVAMEAILRDWAIDDSRHRSGVVMVGDSVANDVVFGKAANVSTALVDIGRRYQELQDGKISNDDDKPDMVVDSPGELASLLWKKFDIGGPLGSLESVPLGKCTEPVATVPAAVAAINGDVAAVLRCMENNGGEPDSTGNTPLVWAADAGKIEVVRAILGLVDGGTTHTAVDVNARGYLGATALCRAARRGHVDVLEALLVEGRANPDLPNNKMQYPLHFAAFKGHREAVKILLQLGQANTRVLDRKGRTPAEDTDDEDIRRLILDARASKERGI